MYLIDLLYLATGVGFPTLYTFTFYHTDISKVFIQSTVSRDNLHYRIYRKAIDQWSLLERRKPLPLIQTLNSLA